MNRFFLAITLLVAQSGSSTAQNYSCPASFVIGDKEANNYTVIYPFGWSKDGFFAYIAQDINGLSEAEFYRYEFHLINTNSDKTESSRPEYYKAYEYGMDSVFTLKMDTLTHFGDMWNSAVLRNIIWPEWKRVIKPVMKRHGIVQSKLEFEKFDDSKVFGFEFMEVQEFGEGGYCMVKYFLDYVDKDSTYSLFHLYGEVNEDALCQDQWGNEVWYNRYDFQGLIRSPFETRAQPYLRIILQSTDGHEEPWENLLITPFVPARF
ncbi:hypothetical protein JYT72_02805 [Crocinitomix catalasitica]|nr:hypothetical protein [Crocinitomix catalasitica]